MTGANDTQVDAMTRDTVAFIDTTVIQANAEVARCMARLASMHTCALAVQGAASHLREVSAVAVAAIGAALGQILAGEPERGSNALAATRQAMADATAHLERLLALSERVTTINVPHS